jgi:hypothetical protein
MYFVLPPFFLTLLTTLTVQVQVPLALLFDGPDEQIYHL